MPRGDAAARRYDSITGFLKVSGLPAPANCLREGRGTLCCFLLFLGTVTPLRPVLVDVNGLFRRVSFEGGSLMFIGQTNTVRPQSIGSLPDCSAARDFCARCLATPGDTFCAFLCPTRPYFILSSPKETASKCAFADTRSVPCQTVCLCVQAISAHAKGACSLFSLYGTGRRRLIRRSIDTVRETPSLAGAPRGWSGAKNTFDNDGHSRPNPLPIDSEALTAAGTQYYWGNRKAGLAEFANWNN